MSNDPMLSQISRNEPELSGQRPLCRRCGKPSIRKSRSQSGPGIVGGWYCKACRCLYMTLSAKMSVLNGEMLTIEYTFAMDGIVAPESGYIDFMLDGPYMEIVLE